MSNDWPSTQQLESTGTIFASFQIEAIKISLCIGVVWLASSKKIHKTNKNGFTYSIEFGCGGWVVKMSGESVICGDR